MGCLTTCPTRKISGAARTPVRSCFGLRHRACSWTLYLAFALTILQTPSYSLIISSVRECRPRGDDLTLQENCDWRSHVNIDVESGMNSYDYVLREKENPNKGIYLHVFTADLTISYALSYIADVPLYYKEHNVTKTYGNMHGRCNECDKIDHHKCSTLDDIPPYLRDQFKNKVCCSCDNNVTDGSPRADFSCKGIPSLMMMGNCANMSCLQIIGPWYSLFKAQQPPEIHRRIFIDAFAFDGDAGIIPDVAKKGYFLGENKDEDRMFLTKAVYKDGHLKFTLTKTRTFEKSKELDIDIRLVHSTFKNGESAKLMDKIIAVPSWPENNSVVQGCSRKYDCRDSSWTEEDEICKKKDGRDCRMERCAYNIRAIEPDAVDTTGVSCNKIGVTMGTWANETRLCNSAPGTCIQNQLGWYINEKGPDDQAKLPNQYGSIPIVARKPVKKGERPSEFEWVDRNLIHSIGYTIREPDVSRIEISCPESIITYIISDVVGFIVKASIDGNCNIASSKPCMVKVITKNTGDRKAPYHHRVVCHEESVPDRSVAEAKESMVTIDPNEVLESDLLLQILHVDITSPVHCEVELYSGGMNLLETVKIGMTLEAPKPTWGLDVRSFDHMTNTDADKIGPTGGSIGDDGKCSCKGFAVICFFKNFNTCMKHFFNKYYTWFVLAIAALVLIIMLPVLIPLVIFLIRRIGLSISLARIRKNEVTVTGNNSP